MGVANIVTFDAHDPRVHNAIPLMGFDNVIPSYQVLKALFKNVDNLVINKDEFMVVSPDEGALNRNMYYASVLVLIWECFIKGAIIPELLTDVTLLWLMNILEILLRAKTYSSLTILFRQENQFWI